MGAGTVEWRWRPEPWWLAAGLFAGGFWGASLGAGWMALAWQEPGWVAHVLAGGSVGGLLGAVTGVAVGAVQSVVVGRDRPLSRARWVAATGGGLATPLVLTLVLSSITHGPVAIWPLLATAAGAGAASSWWIAPRMADRPRLAAVHAD